MVQLLEATPLNEEQREYVQVLRRSTEALITVVNDLPEAGEPSAAGAGLNFQGLRILLVDDAEDNRFLTVRYLKNSGASIDEARDGLEAVRKAQTDRYDVILMDLEMPVMDGFSACRAIRRWESEHGARHTRIIALSAHDPAEALEESLAAGCDELITKPFRKATLIEALSRRSDVADLVPGYLAKRRADPARLRDALAAGDFATIQGIAHKLSGSGGGYGLPQISALGAAMEKAAKALDIPAIPGLIDALENAVRE